MTNALLGLIVQLVTAIIGLLTVFDWVHFTDDQIGAIMLVIAGAWAIVMYVNTYIAGKAKAIREAAQSPNKTESVPTI